MLLLFPQCAFLYPQPSEENEVVCPTVTCPDGQYEGFFLVEKTVRTQLQELLSKELASNSQPGSCESLVAGGLCMALAYIQRCEREHDKHKGAAEVVIFPVPMYCKSKNEIIGLMEAIFYVQLRKGCFILFRVEKMVGLENACAAAKQFFFFFF